MDLMRTQSPRPGRAHWSRGTLIGISNDSPNSQGRCLCYFCGPSTGLPLQVLIGDEKFFEMKESNIARVLGLDVAQVGDGLPVVLEECCPPLTCME